MTATSIHAKAVQKIIAMLVASSDVTAFVPSGRIHLSHISTIGDPVYPAISIHVMAGGEKDPDAGSLMRIMLQIDLWFKAAGKNAQVWDDVFACYQAVLDALHRNGGYDAALGARIIEITNVMEGPQMFEQDGAVMHWPSRFKVTVSPS